MKFFRISFSLLIFSMASHAVLGETHSMPMISLRELITEAQKNNPELNVARQEIEQAKARAHQKGVLDKPRLDFERMYAPRGQNAWSNAEENNMVISQEIPFPVGLYYERKMANKEIKMVEASYKMKEREILNRLRKNYAAFCLTWHHLRLTEESSNLMKLAAQLMNTRYASNQASLPELLKMQMESSKMIAMLEDLKGEKEAMQAEINIMVGRPLHQELQMPEEIVPKKMTWTADELEQKAMLHNSELEELRSAIEEKKAGVHLAQSSWAPDFMVLYRRRNMKTGEDSHDAMLGLTLPLWMTKQINASKEAQFSLAAAKAQYEAKEKMNQAELKKVVANLQSAERQIDLYKSTLLAQSKLLKDSAKTQFDTRNIGVIDYIDAVKTALQTEMEYHEYLAKYESARADLETLIGSDLAEEK